MKTTSIDLLVNEICGGVATIDFLNVDVVGAEMPALRSALEVLGRGGVREASVVLGPASRWEAAEKNGVTGAGAITEALGAVTAAGYDAYVAYDDAHGRGCTSPFWQGRLAPGATTGKNRLVLVKRGAAHRCRRDLERWVFIRAKTVGRIPFSDPTPALRRPPSKPFAPPARGPSWPCGECPTTWSSWPACRVLTSARASRSSTSL